MKYGITFLLCGLICFYGACSLGGWGWFLVWPAMSFFAVGVSYLWMGVKLFGKRSHGTISIISQVLLLPYSFLLQMVWNLYRFFSHEKPYNHLVDNIWIGRRLLVDEYPDDIDMIIDLTCEFSEPFQARNIRSYQCLPILDADIPDTAQLQNILAEILEEQGNIYIHCAQGHGRTGLISAILLMEKGVVSHVEEAIQLLQSQRPDIRLNRKQMEFLQTYWKRKNNGENK